MKVLVTCTYVCLSEKTESAVLVQDYYPARPGKEAGVRLVKGRIKRLGYSVSCGASADDGSTLAEAGAFRSWGLEARFGFLGLRLTRRRK